MVIREATTEDKVKIIALYKKSQAYTNLPDPNHFPPEKLGQYLYGRKAIKRFVVTDNDEIVGHGLIEKANIDHINQWLKVIQKQKPVLYELGGAFVDPDLRGQGIWTMLLKHRLAFVRSIGGVPVTVTWSSNEHVKRTFFKLGGVEVGTKKLVVGSISLFVL